MKSTSKERQTRYRKRITATGGKPVAFMLSAEAAAKLAAWTSKGEAIASVINRLLIKSDP